MLITKFIFLSWASLTDLTVHLVSLLNALIGFLTLTHPRQLVILPSKPSLLYSEHSSFWWLASFSQLSVQNLKSHTWFLSFPYCENLIHQQVLSAQHSNTPWMWLVFMTFVVFILVQATVISLSHFDFLSSDLSALIFSLIPPPLPHPSPVSI